MHDKEPYIPATEPYSLGRVPQHVILPECVPFESVKEPYMAAKEPYILAKEPLYLWQGTPACSTS